MGAFDGVELVPIITAAVTRDGPNPAAAAAAAAAAVHQSNQALYDMCNSTAYNMLIRTFTAESLGHADAVSIPDGQGYELWIHLVALNEGLLATKIDDTQDKYNRSCQSQVETPRQFIARAQVLRSSLITGGVLIIDRNLNKVILRGLILDETRRAILQVYTHQPHAAFLIGLEDQLNLDEMPSSSATQQSSSSSGAHPSNKRSVAAISTEATAANYLLAVLCFNCGLYGHYANVCTMPFNYENRQKYFRGGGKGGGGKGGNRGGGKGGGRFNGRFNNSGQGKRGTSDNFRSAITQLVNAIHNDAPPVTNVPPAAGTQTTAPSATEQAMEHLLNQLFNCAIQGHSQLIVAAIHKRQSLYPPGTVFWLFDTACG